MNPIDLRGCSDADIDALLRVAAGRGAVTIRDQHLSPDELERFVARLGPPMFTPGETPLPGHRFVFEVTNRGCTETPRSVFHSDTSYVEQPPSYSALSAAVVTCGGDTVVIDQRRAMTTLPDSLRAELAGVEFLHIASRVPRPHEAGVGAWHPVLRHHPLTGDPVLFTSARERLVGARRDGVRLPGAAAKELIAATCAHATSGPEQRHRWEPGDVLLLDNRVGLHRADHADVVGERTLHRVMCRGERPRPAQ